MGKKSKCCPDIYKKCYTKEKAISDIDCRLQDLVDRDFLPGISMGIICDGEIIYQKGFGVRNAAEDAFTHETHVQMGDASFQLLSIFLASLANDGTVCSESRLIDLNFRINNNRATEISSSISDLVAGALGYTFNNTKLSWLLCHDPDKVKELLSCRIFTSDFDGNLFRNKVLKFFGANNFLVQSFLNVLADEKLGGGKMFEIIRDYLEANGFTDFGYGTTNFLNEANHADGSLRRDCCWQDTALAENVDNYEASVGAYINIPGALEFLRLLINNGKIGDMELLRQNSLRQWFRHSKTRVDAFDQYCDTSLFEVPEIKVSNAGSFQMAIGGGNFNFYSALTSQGLRTMTAFDKDHRFGVTVLARGKTVFPEALMGYAFGTIVRRDPCMADNLFNFLYRLFNPFLQLQLSNISIGLPDGNQEHHRFRRRTVDIPLDGVTLDSCQGLLNFKEEDGKVFARFGNCTDYIQLFRTSLDNYIFVWKDRSGLEYPGQIQINYNYNQTQIQAMAALYRKDDIQFKQLAPEPDPDTCKTLCVPLPPLEGPCDGHCCPNPYDEPCASCASCQPCGPSPGSSDFSDDYYRYCRPICYDIPEESTLCIKPVKPNAKVKYETCCDGSSDSSYYYSTSSEY